MTEPTLLVLLLIGCIHRVEITTIPAGASLYRDQARLGEAPLTVQVPMFASTKMEARLPGYRSLTTHIHGVGTWSFVSDVLFLHWRKAVGQRPKAEVELRLLPEHGPVGTWDPDAVP